jgi:hypothetical protein
MHSSLVALAVVVLALLAQVCVSQCDGQHSFFWLNLLDCLYSMQFSQLFFFSLFSVISRTPSPSAIFVSPTPSASVVVCTDINGWTDARGDGCFEYSANQFCLPDGSAGSGWDPNDGAFSLYATDGLDATQACCACGKARSSPTPTPTPFCADVVGWQDPFGDGCAEYAANLYCLNDGNAGPNWSVDDFGTIQQNPGSFGLDASQACCACGRGIYSFSQTPSPSTSPSAPPSKSTTPSVSVSPSASPSTVVPGQQGFISFAFKSVHDGIWVSFLIFSLFFEWIF